MTRPYGYFFDTLRRDTPKGVSLFLETDPCLCIYS